MNPGVELSSAEKLEMKKLVNEGVFINAWFNTKLAKRLFKTYVQPELNQRHLPYEVLETEYAGE